MIKTEKDGWEIFEFVCINCNWHTQLSITENLHEVTCPRWRCEAIYKHENGDLMFVGYTQNPFFKRRENFAKKTAQLQMER